MRFTNLKFCLVVALLAMTVFVTRPASTASAKASAAAASILASPLPAVPCPTCECFPTCNVTDSRMLSLAAGGLSTFVGGTIEVGFSSPAAAPSVLIGVFDPGSQGLWDNPTIDLEFDLVADPNNDGTGTTVLATFLGLNAPPALAENDWWDLTFANQAAAQSAPGADFFYFLRIRPVTLNPVDGALNGIKVRTDGTLSLTGQTVQLVAKATTLDEFAIVGGVNPCPGPTTYDGTWEFEFEVKPGTTRLELWDGDFDFGNFNPADLANKDTDDPNTPPINVCEDPDPVTPPNCTNPNIPLWAQGSSAHPEGVAQDTNGPGVGDPPDDNLLCPFTRPPGVFYRLLPPGADASDPTAGFKNANPSGTSEWEKFLISINAADNPDYLLAAIPPGKWRFRIEGMDIFNQFALHYTFTVVPPAASLGDTVFLDTNANGTYEPGLGETGIGNVTLDLLKGDTTCTTFSLAGTQATNASGNYLFTGLADGCYRVTVTDTNNVLAALTKTTGPNPGANNNSQVDPYSANIVGQTSNLTADFGYVGPSCNLRFPSLVKARPRTSIQFVISNSGALPSTVSVKPLMSSACFTITPGYPQQVTIGPGQSAVFSLNAANCPTNASQYPQNGWIVIQSSTCPTRQVQVEWVLR
jgi:hypothetical protein